MRKRRLAAAVVALLAVVELQAIGTIKSITLADGRTTENTLKTPIFDGSASPAVRVGTITSAFDRKAKIVRRGTSGFFTKGPEYNLDRGLDLAALLGESMRAEAVTMGLSAGDNGVRLDGTLHDIYLESKQIPYGATLFYGYMDVELKYSGSQSGSERFRVHHYTGSYNAGMGRRDEAEAALAQLLVHGAQELLARVGRKGLSLKPAAAVEKLQPSGSPAEIYAIGLAGAPAAGTALAAALATEKDEDRREAMLNAIGLLGARDAVSTMSGRYDAETEDCRWYTLKALDYIGTDEAMAIIKSRGTADKDVGPRRLAARVLGKSGT